MNNSDNYDLTQGNIQKKLLLYFLPIAAGTLFQQFYNTVDALVVSKFVGTEALAAVGGSASHICNIIVNCFSAVAGGSTVVIAQLFGARDDERLRKASTTAMNFCLIGGAVLMVIGLIFCPTFLEWMKTPADTMADSITYVRIYFTGIIFVLTFNMCSGILRAVGDSKSPFRYLCFSCACNIVLDLAFVIFFKMGVAGVAIATVIAQGLSTVLVLNKLCKTDEAYAIRFKGIFTPDFSLLKRMLHIGLPAGLQSSMYGISNLLIQVAINTLGTVVVASWSMSGKIDGAYWATMNAAGMAILNFVGQNYGAGKYKRVKETAKESLKLFIGITLGFTALILALGRVLLPLFTDDPEVVETTWHIITYFVPAYVTWTIIEVLSAVLRGCGDALVPAIITCVGICVLRVAWVETAFKAWPTIFVISMSYPISWIVTDVAMIIRYKTGHWLPEEGITNEEID